MWHEDLILYVINLDRSPDRLQSAKEQLVATELNWERVSAIDAALLADDVIADHDLRRFSENVGRPVRRGEIALFASHIKAMQQFLASSRSYAVIFEDDMGIDDNRLFKQVLDSLLRVHELWDIVKLSGVHRHPLPVKQAPLCGNVILGAPLFKTAGNCGYLVNRRAAAAIIDGLKPWDDHFDHKFDHPWRFNMKYRVVWPFVVHERSFLHTIDYGARRTKFSLWQRRKTLFYRMKIGLRRLLYNARHGFFLVS